MSFEVGAQSKNLFYSSYFPVIVAMETWTFVTESIQLHMTYESAFPILAKDIRFSGVVSGYVWREHVQVILLLQSGFPN